AELSALYCSTCHVEPAPDILPRRSWAAALGYMGYWLGIDNIDYLDDAPEFVRLNVSSRLEVLERDGVYPAAPLLNDEDWALLRRYYMRAAPADPLPQAGKPPLNRDLERFQIFRTSYRQPLAITTMVHVRPQVHEIYIGDSLAQSLTVLDGNGQIRTSRQFRPAISPVDIQFVGETAYLGSIGDLLAQQLASARPAHISALTLVGGSIADATSEVVLEDLFRMADIEVADLNGDGRLDFIVCGFGSITGSVAWYEALEGGDYREHVLLPLPGAVKARTHDFNDDGLVDIMVLVSDAREGLHLLINEGGGEFELRTIFETHSAYGHTFLELHDFNGDGLMDALAVNGDNVDSDPYNTSKNYHGLRIYLNRGGLQFEEAWFYPMYGAFIARAADFDADGDLDIAAVSFYPDFTDPLRESFAYLENQGGLEFLPSTSDELNNGRWMTMDIGDVDGDADVDVVLGGSYLEIGLFGNPELYDELVESGESVLILKNTLN
ncbi:MAG: VCBS repeat-containing protein, partial [Rhodospirillales bacterium]|nr:VCBS repeat-containing protein [Rhodospirillales bacterium]